MACQNIGPSARSWFAMIAGHTLFFFCNDPVSRYMAAMFVPSDGTRSSSCSS